MSLRSISLGVFFLSFLAPLFLAWSSQSPEGKKLKVSIIKNDAEGPRYMAEGGLMPLLKNLGCEITDIDTVALTEDDKKEYGAWNRDALESRHIGRLVAAKRLHRGLIIGLLSDCTDLLGMLAGLQHRRTAEKTMEADERDLQREGLAGLKPLRVGLIYFDAHADFNTPETTLSGMLGGMDVAVAAGLCLTRLRLKTGLDPALPTRYIVFGGLRDVDPLEQDLLDRSDCKYLSVEEIRGLSGAIGREMERLSRLTDLVYVHVDMDVLDPSEVSGHPLTAPAGPTSRELAAAIREIFRYPKAAAIGIASIPSGERDKGGLSLKAAYRLIEASVEGMRDR
jgi:arginase family enzyme